MANKTLFNTPRRAAAPGRRAERGRRPAYALRSRSTRWRSYAATGCLNHTFYAVGRKQLDDGAAALCARAGRRSSSPRPRSTLVSAAHEGHAGAAARGPVREALRRCCAQVFARVIDNGKMLRNFVQILRSGVAGRKSLGSAPKRAGADWLERRQTSQLFDGSVGNDPSLADVVRWFTRSRSTQSREALYAWLIGKPYALEALPVNAAGST